MARWKRNHIPGGIYYVAQRGTPTHPLFAAADDYLQFEKRLATVLARCHARVIAYCWTTEAIHMALQVSDVPLGNIMQRLTGSYARYRNRAIGNFGHYFPQRYHAVLIDPRAYLPRLIRYIHHIPVRLGLTGDTRNYLMSSQSAYRGLTAKPWLTLYAGCTRKRSPVDRSTAWTRLNPAERDTSMDDARIFEKGEPGHDGILGSREFLATLPRPSRSRPLKITLDHVIRATAHTLGLEPDEVVSRSRRHELVLARALVTWFSIELNAASLSEVARRLQRDPSTLYVAVQRYRVTRPELFKLSNFRMIIPLGSSAENKRRGP